jgi:hypothetical protein
MILLTGEKIFSFGKAFLRYVGIALPTTQKGAKKKERKRER